MINRQPSYGTVTRRLLAFVGPLLVVLSSGGCSIPVADLPMIGLPSNTPPRPEVPAAYPAVHDIPADRTERVLTADQQEKIEKDLIAARNRQASGVAKTSSRQN